MYEKARIAGIMCDHSARKPQNANLNAVIIAAQKVPFLKRNKISSYKIQIISVLKMSVSRRFIFGCASNEQYLRLDWQLHPIAGPNRRQQL